MMAEALLDYETIDKSQIDEIMAGRKPNPPQSWQDKNDRKPDEGSEPEAESDSEPRPSGPVGGPASEH
jgi:cell division protease FtsH